MFRVILERKDYEEISFDYSWLDARAFHLL